MAVMLKDLLSRPAVRYIAVGGLSYVIEISILFGLYYIVHIPATAATTIAFWVGLFLSFLLMKLLAFQNFQKEMAAIARQGVLYGLLVVLNYLFILIVVGLFPARYVMLSRTIAMMIIPLWNFFIYKRLVFKH